MSWIDRLAIVDNTRCKDSHGSRSQRSKLAIVYRVNEAELRGKADDKLWRNQRASRVVWVPQGYLSLALEAIRSVQRLLYLSSSYCERFVGSIRHNHCSKTIEAWYEESGLQKSLFTALGDHQHFNST